MGNDVDNFTGLLWFFHLTDERFCVITRGPSFKNPV